MPLESVYRKHYGIEIRTDSSCLVHQVKALISFLFYRLFRLLELPSAFDLF